MNKRIDKLTKTNKNLKTQIEAINNGKRKSTLEVQRDNLSSQKEFSRRYLESLRREQNELFEDDE